MLKRLAFIFLFAGMAAAGNGATLSVSHISMYRDIPVFLMSDGTVRALSRPADLEKPVPISGLKDIIAISGSLALKQDGSVLQWDIDRARTKWDEDHIGWTAVFLPAKEVGGLDHVKAIAEGFSFGLALKEDGHVWGWGDDRLGQLGMTAEQASPPRAPDRGALIDPRRIVSKPPRQITVLTGITEISTSNATHALALDNNGHVWAWGDNRQAELGRGQFVGDQSGLGALRVDLNSPVAHVYAGAFLSYATTIDGRLLTWGGCPLSGNDLSPTISGARFVQDISDVRAVSLPDFDASDPIIVLKTDGSVWRVQINRYALFGGGTNCILREKAPVDDLPQVVPESIDFNGSRIAEIAGGSPLTAQYLIALSEDGVVFAVNPGSAQELNSVHVISLTSKRGQSHLLTGRLPLTTM